MDMKLKKTALIVLIFFLLCLLKTAFKFPLPKCEKANPKIIMEVLK